LPGPYVSYELVDGQYALFYHPDSSTKIDLGMRIDISQKCAAWWTSFILTTILGVLGIFGIPTPMDDLTALAQRIVADPNVIETLNSVVGFTFTAITLLNFLKVLYDFGYLSEALSFAVSEISWWSAGYFVIYIVGIIAPTVSPQKALMIANSVILIAQLTHQLTQYQSACGAGLCPIPIYIPDKKSDKEEE